MLRLKEDREGWCAIYIKNELDEGRKCVPCTQMTGCE